jgi:DNA-binding transcriptional ArsR family regulator
MDIELVTRCLAELGNRTRLELFMLLVRAGPDGLTIGELRQRQAIPASTLAFHLRGMVGVGLVKQERHGREVRCRPDFDLLNAALAFVKSECCKGFATTTHASTS